MRAEPHLFARLSSLVAALALAPAVLVGCGDDKEKSKPPPPSKPSVLPSSPPPKYTAAQVRAGGVTPKEMGTGIEEFQVGVESMKANKAPMCSLSGFELQGKPQIWTRQMMNRAKGKDEIKYAQLVALYQEANVASNDFAALKKKAKSCPPKQHVPPKRPRKNFVLLSHDDTWKVTEGNIEGWTHLRGTEVHVEPPSQTKFGVYHVMYDYAVRGNLLITTLYWERTEPGKSGEPIARRATELLTKQLKKMG